MGMLVLSRNEGEDIIITPEDQNGVKLPSIVIKLVAVERRRAKIGIEAPKNYTVNRREIEERVQKQPTNVKKEQKIAPMDT